MSLFFKAIIFLNIIIHPEVDKFNMFADHANEDLYHAGKKAAKRLSRRLSKHWPALQAQANFIGIKDFILINK